MAKKYKSTAREQPLKDALDYVGDIEELAGEMRAWAENTEESFPAKSEEVSEIADTLDEAHSSVEEAVSSIHEAVDNILAIADAKVTYMGLSPYGRKGMPRWMMLANALAPMSAAAEHLQELDQADEELEQELEDHDTDFTDVARLGEDLASAISEVEQVDFPGMY